MNFSDYIVYVDESGDHGLTRINPEFPVFALSLCIIRKDDYVNKIVPQIQQLKFDFWGHDRVILHEHEIRKEKGDFAFLRTDLNLRQNFYKRLNQIISDAPMKVVASVIMKEKLYNSHLNSYNPYHIALRFCMEQLSNFLFLMQQQEKLVHVIVESRGKEEDETLELEFLRIVNEPLFSASKFELKFASKKINSTGLQLADLTARPIALKMLRPSQENRAYEIIKEKFPITGGVKNFP